MDSFQHQHSKSMPLLRKLICKRQTAFDAYGEQCDSRQCFETDFDELGSSRGHHGPKGNLTMRKGCLKSGKQAFSVGHVKWSTKKSINKRRQVSFSFVEFHLHEILLGDNPAVSNGPPLTLSWKAVESYKLHLDKYEASKALPSRDRHQMILPKCVREDWLKAAGYSRSEQVRASRAVRAIQSQRSQSMLDSDLWQKIQCIMPRSNHGISIRDAEAA